MQSEKIVKMLLYPANREHIKMRFHTPQKAMEPVCAGSMDFHFGMLWLFVAEEFIKRRILVQKLLQIPSGIASRVLNGKTGGG